MNSLQRLCDKPSDKPRQTGLSPASSTSEIAARSPQRAENRVQRRGIYVVDRLGAMQMIRQLIQRPLLSLAFGQRLLSPFAFGNVAGDLRRADDCPLCPEAAKPSMRFRPGAVFAPPHGFVMVNLSPRRTLSRTASLIRAIRRYQNHDRLTDDLFSRIAEQPPRLCSSS